jgi:hypothetical protein
LSGDTTLFRVGRKNSDPVLVSFPARLTLWICLLMTLFIGVYPGPLARLAAQAIAVLF